MKSSKPNRPNQNSAQSNDSFLEAFRDLGTDLFSTASNDLLKTGANDIKEALFPLNRSPQTRAGESPEHMALKETELEKNYRSKLRQTENFRRQEKVLFTREQQETREQVSALQEDIKKLAKAISDFSSKAKEAEVAAIQTLPEAGTYHLNFFSHLRKIISELREQIEESSLWLAAWNKKAQKRGFYWNQFKKSGSKFLLSSDRYMATQAG